MSGFIKDRQIYSKIRKTAEYIIGCNHVSVWIKNDIGCLTLTTTCLEISYLFKQFFFIHRHVEMKHIFSVYEFEGVSCKWRELNRVKYFFFSYSKSFECIRHKGFARCQHGATYRRKRFTAAYLPPPTCQALLILLLYPYCYLWKDLSLAHSFFFFVTFDPSS